MTLPQRRRATEGDKECKYEGVVRGKMFRCIFGEGSGISGLNPAPEVESDEGGEGRKAEETEEVLIGDLKLYSRDPPRDSEVVLSDT